MPAVPEREKPEPGRAAQPWTRTAKVTELKDFALPLLTADAVVYQSGMVAIEGDLELGVEVNDRRPAGRRRTVGHRQVHARPVSIRINGSRATADETIAHAAAGHLRVRGRAAQGRDRRGPQSQLRPDAGDRATGEAHDLALGGRHEPDRRPRSSFAPRPPTWKSNCRRRPSLWSAVLDGTPLKPQKQNKIRLIGLPPGPTAAARNLQLVYEAPVQKPDQRRAAEPRRAAVAVPCQPGREAIDRDPPGEYRVDGDACPTATRPWPPTARSRPNAIERPLPAPLVVAETLYELGGGRGVRQRTEGIGPVETVSTL